MSGSEHFRSAYFSWLCLILVMRILNPVTIFLQGAAAAGQVGLSVYILTTIQAMGTNWVGTKVPSFGALAAKKNWAELDHIYRGVLVRSLTLLAPSVHATCA